jgi:hypothetical protein
VYNEKASFSKKDPTSKAKQARWAVIFPPKSAPLKNELLPSRTGIEITANSK